MAVNQPGHASEAFLMACQAVAGTLLDETWSPRKPKCGIQGLSVVEQETAEGDKGEEGPKVMMSVAPYRSLGKAKRRTI